MNEEYVSKKDKIYNYHVETKEYLFSSKAPIDPVETNLKGISMYARPAYSTFLKPPKTGKNEVAIFENNEWLVKNDYRGKEYYTEDGEKIIINKIGEVVPENAILEEPKNFIKPKYLNGKWEETEILFHDIVVKTKKDVDVITSNLIKNCDEEKVKTEKLIAGNNPCESWDIFIEKRSKLIQEGNDFITKYDLK